MKFQSKVHACLLSLCDCRLALLFYIATHILQVKKVNFSPGETVGEGDVIIELEDV